MKKSNKLWALLLSLALVLIYMPAAVFADGTDDQFSVSFTDPHPYSNILPGESKTLRAAGHHYKTE